MYTNIKKGVCEKQRYLPHPAHIKSKLYLFQKAPHQKTDIQKVCNSGIREAHWWWGSEWELPQQALVMDSSGLVLMKLIGIISRNNRGSGTLAKLAILSKTHAKSLDHVLPLSPQPQNVSLGP